MPETEAGLRALLASARGLAARLPSDGEPARHVRQRMHASVLRGVQLVWVNEIAMRAPVNSSSDAAVDTRACIGPV